jgi:hypothetical protein
MNYPGLKAVAFILEATGLGLIIAAIAMGGGMMGTMQRTAEDASNGPIALMIVWVLFGGIAVVGLCLIALGEFLKVVMAIEVNTRPSKMPSRVLPPPVLPPVRVSEPEPELYNSVGERI